ncbi:ribonuclease HII [Clostridium niameyense]|uniref:Ribonuclease HII n=1 Tax=Clostridium niameyense TaxID=1622073 RepID=A0A6M0RA40_9CLOT|nr:ribonuclease HII [Clostridium niameyense]NEZ46068.1 ribonuclease HII [Clostridium niameyense]
MNINTAEDFQDIKYVEIKKFTDTLKKNYETSKENEVKRIINLLNLDKRKNVKSLGESLLKFLNKYNKEIDRVTNMYNLDKSFYPYEIIAGVDEVGRGPLAGPIVAASVILDLNTVQNLILDIKDSKKLSPQKRKELNVIIREKALSYNIAIISNNIIDEKGIAWSNNEVLKRAVQGLKIKPDLVLSDGYAVKNMNLPNKFIVKGDNKSASIACASIIAKVYRDNLMEEYAKVYPQYGFEHNAGYGTQEHIESIQKYGPLKIHRRSFLKNII